MITHVVLLTPRHDLTQHDRRAFATAFERAVREIPTVRSVRLGKRITVGAGYEQGMPDTSDLLAVIDFDDVDGLQTYLRHEAHAELGVLFGRSLSAALVYDFEVGGLEMIATLF